MKKIATLLLALVMLCSMTGALAEYNELQWPLVQDGEDVTLTVAVIRSYSYTSMDPNDSWIWKYLEAKSGIKFDVIPIDSQAVQERKNLMFASNELPDILIGLSLTTAEMVKYGVGEGQLLPLEEYITEDIMPNLYAWTNYSPIGKILCTAPDGHMYTLPGYSAEANAIGNTTNVFINTKLLGDMGLKNPETLDEVVDVLYKVKAAYPDMTPLAFNNITYRGTFAWLLRAYGYVTDGYATTIAVKDGKAVYPMYEDIYKDYLALLHQFYKDGIISPDIFTMDDITLKAEVAENKALIFGSMPYICDPDYEFYKDWESVHALTSEYNDTPIWKAKNTINIGAVAVSAKTEYPELCMRLLDFFWSDFGGFALWEGPMAGTEDTMGLVEGWKMNEDYTYTFLEVANGKYANNQNYVRSHGLGVTSMGNRSRTLKYLGTDLDSLYITMDQTKQEMAGMEIRGRIWDDKNGDSYARKSKYELLSDCQVNGYPAHVYFTEEDTIAMSDLSTVISNYANAEIAKFITGVRSLDEFADFQAELESMGIEELLEYQQKGYDVYLAAQAQ